MAERVYIRKRSGGGWEVGRTVSRDRSEMTIAFGSEKVVCDPRRPSKVGITTVASGGLRHRWIESPEAVRAEWAEDPVGVIAGLICEDSSPTEADAVRAELQRCGLVEDGLSDDAWDELDHKLRSRGDVRRSSRSGIVSYEPTGAGHSATGSAMDPVAEHLRSGGHAQHAVDELDQLTVGASTERIITALRSIVDDDSEDPTPAFRRVADLAKANSPRAVGLTAALVQLVAAAAGASAMDQLVPGASQTERPVRADGSDSWSNRSQKLASATISLLGKWLKGAGERPELAGSVDSLVAILLVPGPPARWSLSGPRVTVLKALIDQGLSARMKDARVWGGLEWSALIDLLHDEDLAPVLSDNPLRVVIRACIEERLEVSEEPAAKLGAMLSAPAPIPAMVPPDALAGLLSSASHRRDPFGTSLESFRAQAEGEGRRAASALAESDAAAVSQALAQRGSDNAELRVEVARLTAELEHAKGARRAEVLDNEARRQAEIRHHSLDTLRALARILTDLQDKAAEDPVVSTILASAEASAAQLGMTPVHVVGERVSWDRVRHELLDGHDAAEITSADEVTVVVPGYELQGAEAVILHKALVRWISPQPAEVPPVKQG